MSKKTWIPLLIAAGLAVSANVSAQSKDGYWTQGGGPVWKNTVNQCWKSAYWTPAMAIAECDPDLMPKPKPAACPRPRRRPSSLRLRLRRSRRRRSPSPSPKK